MCSALSCFGGLFGAGGSDKDSAAGAGGSNGDVDDHGPGGGFGAMSPMAFAFPAISGSAISKAVEFQWTLLLAAGMAAGNDALVQHVRESVDLMQLYRFYLSSVFSAMTAAISAPMLRNSCAGPTPWV